MEFTINIEKRHVYLLAGFIVLVGIFSVLAAQPSIPFHPLQQITTDETGSVSIDANSDGVIDNAENAVNADNSNMFGGLSSSAYCRSDGTDCSNTLTALSCPVGQCVIGFDASGTPTCGAP